MSYLKIKSNGPNNSSNYILVFVSLFLILATLFNACEGRLSRHRTLNNNQRLTNSLEDTDNNSQHHHQQHQRKVYFQPNELEYESSSEEYPNDLSDYSEELDSFRPKKMDNQQLLTEKKNDALIQAFKVKLLELLDVDPSAVPDASAFDQSQIPEAIYKHAMHDAPKKIVRNRSKNSKVLRHRFKIHHHSRKQRQKAHEDSDDEHIRFNSSITKEITLFTENLAEVNRDADWCQQVSYSVKYNSLIPLNCFKFKLDQEAFQNSRIQTAKLYFKLDNDAISEQISEPLFVFQPSSFNRTGYIYIEINGFLVKRIDLTKIRSINEDYAFKHVDIRNVLNEMIAYNDNPYLKIRLLAGEDLLSQFSSVHRLKSLFESMDENMALNVKFGGVDPEPEEKRRKRTFGTETRSAGHHFKMTRNCESLRRMGYTSSNYSCCRESLFVTMEQLGWSHWILSPKVIEYKYCRGGCLTGQAPRYDNTHIIYRMFELSNTFETTHCCNIYDYEEPITFIYGEAPNFQKRLISLNAKNCLCS